MKKILKVIGIVLLSLVLLGVVFGTIDYIRAKNNKVPIFSFRSYGFSEEEVYVEDGNSEYSGVRYGATEYYGLGYKIVVCYSCNKDVYFMPLYIGTYAWFIGMPVDKLNGKWFDAYSNDLYLYFDGIGNYSLTDHNNITAKGTYIIEDEKVILNENNGKKVECSIKNNYYELYCNGYTERFMK